jgi:hypothetical protein
VCGIVWLRGLFIGLRRVLETLVNLGNSEFHLLVKLGDNPITNQNRIRPKLAPILRGNFGIASVRIEKIIFHNHLYNFELAFQCRWNHLNPIFELKFMAKILRHMQNPNLNPIRF